MLRLSAARMNVQSRQTEKQRSSLDQLSEALALKCRRECYFGDHLQFIKNIITLALPGLPPSEVNALAAYFISDPIHHQINWGSPGHRSDALNDLSSMDSIRLQMMMDRISKFEETLSNIMKKLGDTQASIIQNLK